jgi:hypothetical protein
LAYFALEGRTFGSNEPFASNVEVEAGDRIEYRLRLSMAPEGTLNQHVDNRPDRFRAHKHGFNSLSFSITQDSIDPIQVDLSSPVELAAASSASANDSWGWSWAPGHSWAATPGTPATRPGTGLADLLGIRPLHAPGVFTAREEEIIFTGSFSVNSIAGPSGEVGAEWGPISGGGWFHGYSFFPTMPTYDSSTGLRKGTEVSSDPLAHFTPLTLTAANLEVVPEPSAIALVGVALFFVFGGGLRRSWAG